MDNPEALETFGTQDTDRRQIQQQKIKKMSNTDSPKNRGLSHVLANGKQLLSLITHTLLLTGNTCWTLL
jgi:hypothetical protein